MNNAPAPPLPPAPRILILRLSALGDILHGLPMLGCLRERFPDAHLGWVVEPGGAPLLIGHPLLDRVHVFPKKAWRAGKWSALRGPIRDFYRELRSEHYDIAIDAQGLTKSAMWGWLAGIPRRIGFRGAESRELAGLLATERVMPDPGRLHVSERNLCLLRPLGIEPPAKVRFPVHLPEAAREHAEKILGDTVAAAPLVVMSLGAGWATKIWPAERFAELARRLVERQGVRVALAWGPGEQALVQTALTALGRSASRFDEEMIPPAPGVYVLPGTTFVELGAVIARACLFVGGDTGPTHLAAALGVPTVSMMGPLDARRNGPLGDHCLTVQHAIPRKAPWGRKHTRWCDPLTRLDLIGVDEILTPCEAFLRQP